MAKMGRYCKAYHLNRFREFSGWTENLQNLRKEEAQTGEQPVETERQLKDDNHLYLQESFIVTDGVFLDENIIFNNVTPEWIEFCKNSLKFEPPTYETASVSEPGASLSGLT